MSTTPADRPRGLWMSTKLVGASATDTAVEVMGAVSTLAHASNILANNAVIGAEFSNTIFEIETEALLATRLAELKLEHPDLPRWKK